MRRRFLQIKVRIDMRAIEEMQLFFMKQLWESTIFFGETKKQQYSLAEYHLSPYAHKM